MSERKEKIKSIAIVFLSIMLVLTFFSNTIMNYSLVEVSTQAVYGGSITTKVRGSGTAEAEEGYAVTVKEERKIETVKVRVGAEVEEGDVLITLAPGDSTQVAAAKEVLEQAEAAYEAKVLNSGITVAQRQEIERGSSESLTEKQNAILNAETELKAAREELEALRAEAAVAYDAYVASQDKVTAAQAAYDAAVNSETSTDTTENSTTEKTPEQLKKELDAAKAELAANQQKLSAAQDACYYANEKLKEIEASASTSTLEYYNLEVELRGLYEAVCEAQEALAKLQAEDGSSLEIKAPMAGTITEINCYAGQTVDPTNESLMQIKPASEAFTMQFTVSESQARRIKVGDPAEILYNWSGNDVSARVRSIQKDPMNRTSSIVTCELTGDVYVGDYYTVSIGEQSSNYDYVVPTSCIREDSNGKFILIIESKSTPLGNRYYARRADVEVITSDDSQSAITGAFDGYFYVITTTTKPVEENQQVRLAE